MRSIAFLAAAFLAIASPALADPTVYDFSGQLDDIRVLGAGGESAVSQFSTGDSFHGQLTYDASSPLGYMIDPTRALFIGSPDPFTGSFDNVTVVGTSSEVQLFDNAPFDMLFIASAYASLPSELSANTAFDVLRFQLRDSTGTVINNMQLPGTLELADYDQQRQFSVTGYDSSGGLLWILGGNIQSLEPSAVPEPSTWAMMLMGFAGIGLAFRKQRRLATV